MQLQFIQKYSRNLNLDKVRSVRTDNFDNRKHAAKIFIQMTFDQVGNLPFWCSGLLYSWTFFRFITFIRICFMGIIVLLIESMFVIVHQSGRERNSPFCPFFFSITKKNTQVYQVRLRHLHIPLPTRFHDFIFQPKPSGPCQPPFTFRLATQE